MSVESLSRALNYPDVTAAERLVLIGIANHDGDGGAWPSIETLARYACVTPRSVQRTLRRLVTRGLVSVEYQQGGTHDCRSGRRPNRYRLHLIHTPDTHVTREVIHTGDTGGGCGVTLASPKPSLNRPTPPTPRKRGARRRQQDEGRRDYDSIPLTPQELAAKYGVEA